MSDLTPITRDEHLLNGDDLEPKNRKEMFIKRIYDKTQEIPEPETREEWFLKKAGNASGDITVEQLNVTENGTYSASGKAYSPVIVEVPSSQSYLVKDVPNLPQSIATFDDGQAEPLRKLKFTITPVQSGSGDPYPAGGGKNKLNLSDISGTATSRYYIDTVTDYVLEEGVTYTLSINVQSSITPYNLSVGVGDVAYRSDISNKTNFNNGRVSITFTPTSTHLATYNKFAFRVPKYASTSDFTYSLTEAQLEIGSTATPYAPYSNIRPISGWSGVEWEVCGVNLWDEEWEQGVITSGEKVPNTSCIRSKNYISVKPNKTYYLYCGSATNQYFIRPVFYDLEKHYIENGAWCANGTFTTPDNCYYIYLTTQTASSAQYGGTYNNDISINYPSTDTTYHAHNTNTHTYSVSWQTEAGTVYGGSIDPITGILEACPYYASYNGETLVGEWISDRDVYSSGGTPTTGAQVVNIGGTKTTYQLSPTQVLSLLADNNIFADVGDVTECRYVTEIL